MVIPTGMMKALASHQAALPAVSRVLTSPSCLTGGMQLFSFPAAVAEVLFFQQNKCTTGLRICFQQTACVNSQR